MLINKLIPILYIIFINITVVAQPTTWVNTLGGESSDESFDCYVCTDSTFLFCGVINDTAIVNNNTIFTQGDDMFIAKSDTNGNLLWIITGGSADEGYCKASSITSDSDGNTYFGGYTSKNFSIAGKNYIKYNDASSDSFIGKLNNKGEIEWIKMLLGPGSDIFEKLTITDNGIIFSLRYSDSIYIDGNPITSEYPNISSTYINSLVGKLDKNGTLQWATKFNGKSSFIRNIQNGSTNDVFFSCETSIETASPFITRLGQVGSTPFENPIGNKDTYLCRLNGTDGSVSWINRIGGSLSDMSYAIALDSIDNIYGSILFQSEVQFSSQNSSLEKLQPVGGGYDLGYYKYSANGNFEWAKTLGGSSHEGIYDMAVSNDGNIYVACYVLDPGININNTEYNVIEDGVESLLFSFTPNGDINWSQITDINYTSTEGSKSITRTWGIAIAKNNNILICGSYQGQGKFFEDKTITASPNSKNIFYALIAPRGITNAIPSISEIKTKLWYNNGFLYIDDVQQTEINIFGPTGKLISKETYSGSPINISYLQNSMYIVRYTDNNKPMNVRFIKY